MKKRILIVTPNLSIHLVNFIDVTLKEFDNRFIDVIITNPIYEYTGENADYLKNNGIHVIYRKKSTENSKINQIMLFFSFFKLRSYDICFIHYFDRFNAMLINIYKYKFQYIIPVAWGSDVLRNSVLGGSVYKHLFKISFKIIFNTEYMLEVFESFYRHSFTCKSLVIPFPIRSIEEIDKIKNKQSVFEMKNDLELPEDKIIVLCGHSATRNEQYELMIESLKKVDEELLEKCYFIFMMTYGDRDKELYQGEIKNILDETSLNYIIMAKYLDYEKILKFQIISDIHITSITTDSFSAVMVEQLYTNSILIYGLWLNYLEINQLGIYAKSFNTFDDLSKVFSNALIEFDSNKINVGINNKIIKESMNSDAVEKMWKEKVFQYII
ncbi:MAG: hypothetical protein RR500_04285 [Bacilli bacterium]